MGRERAKPISFSSKVLNIHVVWALDERPLTGVISVSYPIVALKLLSRYGQRGPISFSSKVLNIQQIVWSMDERPIGPLTVCNFPPMRPRFYLDTIKFPKKCLSWGNAL